MPDDRKRRAFSAVLDSAADQAALAVRMPAAPVEPAPASNGHVAPQPKRQAAAAPAKAAPPPTAAPSIDQLVDAVLAKSYGETSLYGFTVPDLPADQDREVHFTVRVPKTLRLAIQMFCARYDLTAQDFAQRAFDLLMTVAEQRRLSEPAAPRVGAKG